MGAHRSSTDIQLSEVTKRYGSVTAVEDIDLEIQEGEFVVIVGPSGCGKSTTLRMIAGLEQITSGELYFGGDRVTDVEPKNRNVAMVFQNYALYPHMTVRRNMSFGMQSNATFSDEEVESRVHEAAETLDIAEYLDRKPGQLSGGERQRVAIGRALVRDPDVLLLDEPLSNLDAKLRLQMRTELAELHDELQTTTVYVTHDQTEAMTLGDRVVVMQDGEIQQVDTPQELYDYPRNLFVANFIGSPSMNTVPVDIEADDGTYYATGSGRSLRLPLPGSGTDSGLSVGEAVLGIRPEDMHLSAQATDRELSFPLEVSMTESLGDVLLVYGTVAGDEITVQLDAHAAVEQGDELTLHCDPDRIHLFDDVTGGVIYQAGRVAQREAPV